MHKNCCNDCINCEMLIEDESIVFVKQGFNETRRVVPAVKCMCYGQYATTIVELPRSRLLDDMVWE